MFSYWHATSNTALSYTSTVSLSFVTMVFIVAGVCMTPRIFDLLVFAPPRSLSAYEGGSKLCDRLPSPTPMSYSINDYSYAPHAFFLTRLYPTYASCNRLSIPSIPIPIAEIDNDVAKQYSVFAHTFLLWTWFKANIQYLTVSPAFFKRRDQGTDPLPRRTKLSSASWRIEYTSSWIALYFFSRAGVQPRPSLHISFICVTIPFSSNLLLTCLIHWLAHRGLSDLRRLNFHLCSSARLYPSIAFAPTSTHTVRWSESNASRNPKYPPRTIRILADPKIPSIGTLLLLRSWVAGELGPCRWRISSDRPLWTHNPYIFSIRTSALKSPIKMIAPPCVWCILCTALCPHHKRQEDCGYRSLFENTSRTGRKPWHSCHQHWTGMWPLSLFCVYYFP